MQKDSKEMLLGSNGQNISYFLCLEKQEESQAGSYLNYKMQACNTLTVNTSL